MTRGVVAAGLALWVGATLLLARARRVSRPTLTERLRPYHPGGRTARSHLSAWSVASISALFGPAAREAGDAIARLFGASESVDTRLRRIHAPLDATGFRLRQLGWSGAALLAAVAVCVIGVPLPIALLLVIGAPLLAFLIVEQRLIAAAAHWQQQARLELPVVSE